MLLPISDVFQLMWSYISISGSSFVTVLEEPECSWLSAVSFEFRHWYFCHIICCGTLYRVYLHKAVNHYICTLPPHRPNHCYLHCLLPMSLFYSAAPCHTCPTPQYTTILYTIVSETYFFGPPPFVGTVIYEKKLLHFHILDLYVRTCVHYFYLQNFIVFKYFG